MGSSSGNTCLAVFKIILYLCFGVAIPIACIVIAAKYDGQCPVQPYVNIYLYVAGAFCAFRGIMGLIVQIAMLCGCCEDGGSALCLPLVLDILVGIFLFCWFIAGSVWVYKLKGKFSIDPEEPTYCNPDLYKFAFAILTTQWVLNAVSMILSALGSCCKRD